MYKLKLDTEQLGRLKREQPQARIVSLGNDIFGVENISEQAVKTYVQDINAKNAQDIVANAQTEISTEPPKRYKAKLTTPQLGELKRDWPQSRIVATMDGVYEVENVPEKALQKYQLQAQPQQMPAKQADIDFNYLLNTFVATYAKATVEKEVAPLITKIEAAVSHVESRFDGLTTEIDGRIKNINDVVASGAQNIQQTREEILGLVAETKAQLEKIAKQFDDKVYELANDLEKNITAKIKEHLSVEIQALQDERQMIKHTLEQENKATNERICKIADHYRKFLQDFPKIEDLGESK